MVVLNELIFLQVSLWKDVVVLKGVIWGNFNFRRVSYLEGTDFLQFQYWEDAGGLERLIFVSIHFGREW